MIHLKSFLLCVVLVCATYTSAHKDGHYRHNAHLDKALHVKEHQAKKVAVVKTEEVEETIPEVQYTSVEVTGVSGNTVHVEITAEYTVNNTTNDNVPNITISNLLNDSNTTMSIPDSQNVSASEPEYREINGKTIAYFVISLDYLLSAENVSLLPNSSDFELSENQTEATTEPVSVTVTKAPEAAQVPEATKPATEAAVNVNQQTSSPYNTTFIAAMGVVACVALVCAVLAVGITVRMIRNNRTSNARSVLEETATDAASPTEETSAENDEEAADEEIDLQATSTVASETNENCAV